MPHTLTQVLTSLAMGAFASTNTVLPLTLLAALPAAGQAELHATSPVPCEQLHRATERAAG